LTVGGLLVAFVVGVVAYVNVVSIGRGITDRAAQSNARVELGVINRLVSDLQIDERDAVLVPISGPGHDQQGREVEAQFKADLTRLAASEQKLRGLSVSSADRATLDQLLTAVDAYSLGRTGAPCRDHSR
jgi:hypothetical protein